MLSFTRAADELALTQSPVSRQIQTLEEGVGLPLFRRVGNRLVLTEAGENYHHEIAPLLESLRSATLRLIAFKGAGSTLRLVVLPTLGMKWLVPRFLVVDEIRAGQLREAWPHVLEGPRPYCLAYPERKAHDPAATAIRVWLQVEAAAFEAGDAD